jgi:hypothetical protein
MNVLKEAWGRGKSVVTPHCLNSTANNEAEKSALYQYPVEVERKTSWAEQSHTQDFLFFSEMNS